MKHTTMKTTIRAAMTAALTIASSAIFPSYAMTNITESFVLTADTDWRGKGEVALAQGETIDLAGHRLSLSAIAGSGTVTDTAGGGVVYMEVPAGRSVVNTNVTFTGKLRFVKAGSGLYRQACMYQSYEGGTLVEAGTLCGRDRDLNIKDKMNWGRAGTEIRVERGATLDLRNSCNNCYWHIVLNGGCLRLKDYLAKPHEDAQIQRLTLLADSSMEVCDSGFIGSGYGKCRVGLNGLFSVIREKCPLHSI